MLDYLRSPRPTMWDHMISKRADSPPLLGPPVCKNTFKFGQKPTVHGPWSHIVGCGEGRIVKHTLVPSVWRDNVHFGHQTIVMDSRLLEALQYPKQWATMDS